VPKKRRRTLSWKILNLQNNRVLYYKRMASTYDELCPHFSAVAPYMRAHSVVSTSLMWRYAARHIHDRCVHAWTSSSTQTHETCVRAYVRACSARVLSHGGEQHSTVSRPGVANHHYSTSSPKISTLSSPLLAQRLSARECCLFYTRRIRARSSYVRMQAKQAAGKLSRRCNRLRG